MNQHLNVTLQFGGGIENLFSNKRTQNIQLPATFTPPNTDKPAPSNIQYLIQWMKQNILQEREELFIENDTVRPGILVLVNDTDWELEGEGEYVIQDGDEIVFISTLHGG
ncbi:Ubiquitin- modifier 1 [Tulasnella sp. 419]|nr:Ubiquitin- modifier 1 [Tulasnella sp. 418]KAG8958803.1 Ubiquitin- modifier 1 [Tulasnella sp. 419]